MPWGIRTGAPRVLLSASQLAAAHGHGETAALLAQLQQTSTGAETGAESVSLCVEPFLRYLLGYLYCTVSHSHFQRSAAR